MERIIKRKTNGKKKIIISIAVILLTISIIIASFMYKFKNKLSKENNMPNEIILDEEQSSDDENIIIDISQLSNEIVDENSATDNEKENNKIEEKTNNSLPYYIKINYQAQVVTVYGKDEKNEYTIPVKAILCSTGTFTPKSGTYKTKAKWRWGALQGNVAGQYCTKITGNILFHSVPYLKNGNPASLEYWEYDKLGSYASAGCIRMNVSNAQWIYNNCSIGTSVEFYSDSNPGPLGKPAGTKISNENEELRNWDPTDPDESNPWKNASQSNNNSSTSNENNTSANNNTNQNTISNITNNQIDKNNTISNSISNKIENNTSNEINKNESSTNESKTNNSNTNLQEGTLTNIINETKNETSKVSNTTKGNDL